MQNFRALAPWVSISTAALALTACQGPPSNATTYAAAGAGPDTAVLNSHRPRPKPSPTSSTDPAYYNTPTPVGTGLRTVSLTASSAVTLQQALDQSQPGDVIELASGTYPQNSRLS